MAILPAGDFVMKRHRKIFGAACLATVLFAAGTGMAAAELQDCFRDGYLCSLKCAAPGADKSISAQCEARCNDDEKLCIGKVAEARGRPGQPAYSPAIAPMKAQWPGNASR
jgi:hypothetical protein